MHTRIGGFAGSNLQLAQCPTAVASNTTGIINPNCIAAFMSMYIAPCKYNPGREFNNSLIILQLLLDCTWKTLVSITEKLLRLVSKALRQYVLPNWSLISRAVLRLLFLFLHHTS